MAQGQVYDVPESQYIWFKKEIEKLQKKAAKLTDDKVTFVVVGKRFEPLPKGKHGSGQNMLEIFISAPEVKLEGYEIIGKIDHTLETGNIIKELPGRTMPSHFFDADANCSHCNVRRPRNDTWILKCDEAYVQVGRTCLVDFTGHKSPEKLLKLAEIIGNIRGLVRATHSSESRGEATFLTSMVAAEAAREILQRGYISQKQARESVSMMYSSADNVRNWWNTTWEYNGQQATLAEEALEWARNIEVEDNSWRHNIKTLAESPTCEYWHVNMITSLVGAYWKNHWATGLNARASRFQGKIGERIEWFQVALRRVTKSKFGYRHVFEDINGNRFVWFKDTTEYENCVGHHYMISGKVRSHNVFTGEQQTDLNTLRIKPLD